MTLYWNDNEQNNDGETHTFFLHLAMTTRFFRHQIVVVVNLLLLLSLSSPLLLVHCMTIMNPSSAVSSSAAAAAAKTTAAFRIRPSIILFGDSITQQAFGVDDQATGWASLLAAAYSRRADVFNRGFSGYNTQWAVDRLLTRVFGDGNSGSSNMSTTTTTTTTGVAFCTVFFGANDAALPGQRQHVPIDQYQQNLVTIVKHIQSSLSAAAACVVHTNSRQQEQQQPLVILLLTPPPFDADAWMTHKGIDSPGRSNDVAREYGDRVKLVAEQINNDNDDDDDGNGTAGVKCAVIDTWNLLKGAGPNKEHYSQYLSDGLHLNEAGNRIVYEAIMDVLQRQFPHVAPRPDGIQQAQQAVVGLPLEEPLWDELC